MNAVIRKYILQHAHPAKFVAEILGIMWSSYFLWHHNWPGAIISAVAFFLLSTVLLWGPAVDLDSLENTMLGKMFFVYTKPVSFFLYNFSALPLIYGLWTHKNLFVFLAVSILLFPHLWTTNK
jgi:hypothetical protein